MDIEKEIQFKTSRSGGPGGQHVNKVNTRVTARWPVGTSALFSEVQKERIRSALKNHINSEDELILHEESTRSQLKNKEKVIAKLKYLLAKVFKKRKKRIQTKPTKSSVRKRLDSKRKIAEKKNWRRKLE